MPTSTASRIPDILASHATSILGEWHDRLRSRLDDRVSIGELETQCRMFITRLTEACRRGPLGEPDGSAYGPVRDLLAEISRQRAIQGVSPSESTGFVFSLKPFLFARLVTAFGGDVEGFARDVGLVTELLDTLGLFMMEQFQQRREEVIARQQDELAELSTPVVKLWQGILALPLIGTLELLHGLQIVMENLLESIVRHEADIAIIDITGVPTVDTLVAQHLLKTVAAARLMGADCIISGIRPQIAQTMVHLGVELNVVSKANMADAFALALQRLGKIVVAARRPVDVGPAMASDGGALQDRIPILKLGAALLVTIQVDMHDQLAMALEEDLTSRIVETSAKGVLIDISALEIVDSFIGRTLANIASIARVLDAETVVVGMRPAVAITLVELGLSLPGVRTALNAERGMSMIRARIIETDLAEADQDLGPA